MKVPFILFLLVTGLSPVLVAQPVITEVMPKPVSADGEFVELFNLSTTDSFDISGLKLKDNLTLTSLVHVSGPKKLPPAGFAIILDRDYFESGSSGQYNDLLPPGIPVYKTSNASIGNGLGNTTDQLALLSSNGKDTLSFLSWTLPANFPSGFSIEKRNVAGPKSDGYPSKNWSQSVWPYGSPGLANEVPFIPLSDLALKLIGVTPEKPWFGDSVRVHLRVINAGLFNLVWMKTKILELDEGNNLISEQESGASPPGSGDSLSFTISVFPGSLHSHFLFRLITTGDEIPRNDTVSVIINVQTGLPGDVELISVKPDTSFIQTGSQTNFVVRLMSHDCESGTLSLSGKVFEWNQNGWIEIESLPVQAVEPFIGGKKVLLPIPTGKPGRFKANISIQATADPNPANDTLSVQYSVFYPVSDSALSLSELMPNPEGTDGFNEFIELVNPLLNKTADLTRLKLVISGKTELRIQGRNQFINPGERVLVHHPLYYTQTIKLYDGIEDTLSSIPAVTSLSLVMKNTNERVALVSFAGDTLDSFSWISDPGNGVSWEKMVPEKNKNLKNWGKSMEHHGTPGWQNSLFPPENKIRTSIRLLAGNLKTGNQVKILMKVENLGRQPVNSGTLTLFSFVPGQNREQLFSTFFPAGTKIDFGDSVVAETEFRLDQPGKTKLVAGFETAGINWTSDTLSLQIPFEAGSLLINEFLPVGDQTSEFIELFNPTDFPVSLDGWQISNSSSTGKVTLHGSEMMIKPRGYGVLVRDTTGFSTLLQSGKVWWIKTLPAMKDTGDVIKLVAPGGIKSDSLTYRNAWGGGLIKDYSLEKTGKLLPSASSENWMTSWERKGTPGKQNSRTSFQNNVALLQLDRVVLRPGETRTVFFEVQNRGKLAATRPSLTVWPDANRDFLPDSDEPLVVSKKGSELFEYGEILEIPVTGSYKWTEMGQIMVQISPPEDENPDDNQRSIEVKSSVNREVIQISEIMFDPLQNANDGKPDHSEYVEVLNPGTEPVSLENWTISDQPTETGKQNAVVIKSSFTIYPGEYAVLAADSGFFNQFPGLSGNAGVCVLNVSSLNLNADQDAVIIRDQWGSVVDSVFYSAKWHSKEFASTKDISLERRDLKVNTNDPLNWSSSVNPAGGTPGFANSIKLPESVGSKSSVWITPNPFSPDGDGRDDVCELHYRFSEPVSSASVTIYDRLGRKIKDLKPWSVTAPEGVIFWDGKKEDGQIAPIGPYIFLTEFMNPAGGKIHEGKTVVILAKKM